jgi:hypothetical protein
MLSITSYMDERDIAQEVVMERMVHKGSFILLEGKTDVKRFRPYLCADECSIVSCHSVRKATGALRRLVDRNVSGVLAVIDADFSRVQGITLENANTVVSENHDLDLDWINTGSFERYLNEVGHEAKIIALGGCDAIVRDVHETLQSVSTGRLLNAKRVFNFKTSGIDVGKFYKHGQDITGDYVDALVDAGYVDVTRRDWIELEINSEKNTQKDEWQMTNGHDFCAAIGSMLRGDIGSRKAQQCFASEIETHIRLTFNKDDFLSLSIAAGIISWEEQNPGYRVLAPALAA